MTSIAIKEIEIPPEVLEKWQNVVDIMAEVLSVPSAILTRVDPPEIKVLRAADRPANPYNSGDKVLMAQHYCESVVTNNRKLQVSYAPTDPVWNQAPEIKYGMLAYLGYPVCWPSGQIFGTLCVLDSERNDFGARYEKVLIEFRELVEAHLSLLEMNEQLTNALAEVNALRGLLPICSICKRIRDDRGYWNQIEMYIHEHSGAEFSHGICPDCMREHYPEYADD